MKKIFLICPVRNIPPEVEALIKDYVTKLRARGDEIHWPQYDTDQNDPIGFSICFQNGTKIYEAHEIHVWFSKGSEGSIFDFGMTFLATAILGMKKRVVIANPQDIQPTPHKSFQNVLLELARRTANV